MLTPPKVPDHKAVICSFRDHIQHDKGYWKLNVKLLNDDAYTSHIRETISSVKNEFENYVDKRTLWDVCKIRIREASIKWSIKLAKQSKQERI